MEKRSTVLPRLTPESSAKKRIAAYCRVSSTKDEQLHSLIAQTEYYTEEITKNEDYVLAGIYADEGISGTQTKNRTAFNRLMDDCRNGLIDGIITKSVSRFGRNTVDTLQYTRELKLLGIDVFFEKENIHSANAEGELLLTLMSALAQNECYNLSDNIKWGLQRKYEKGCAESQPLGKFYGYSQCKRRVTIIEDEAVVVRRVFREFLDGNGPTEIARHLTEDGVPTERGNMIWRGNRVASFLTREKYMGDAIFRKTFIADPISHKRIKNKGEREQYYAEDCFPAIIDKTTWELTQLELARQEQYCAAHRISVYHRYSSKTPFSTKIICQTCGRTYKKMVSKIVGNEGTPFWRCTGYLGKQWAEIPGRTFTPRPQPIKVLDRTKRSVRYNKRVLPEERTMRCSDIELPYDRPEKSFVRAWNLLCGKALRYTASLKQRVAATDEPLLKYRCSRLIELMAEHGRIDKFDYDLFIQTVDHFEVTPDRKLRVLFLADIVITV